MKSNKKLMEIVFEIYRQMYKESNPPADFDKLMKSGVTKKPDWFMEYYLPMERQVEIINQICKEHKIYGRNKHKISVEIHLGSSPNSSIKKGMEFEEKGMD